jgi:hypothetical protein
MEVNYTCQLVPERIKICPRQQKFSVYCYSLDLKGIAMETVFLTDGEIIKPVVAFHKLSEAKETYTVKKGKLFCTLAEYGLTYDRRFPQQVEEYFYCHPQRFFASDRPGIHSINKEGIFPSI